MRTLRASTVVVGSGPNGAAAAWRLASRGEEVLIIERGHRVPFEQIDRARPDWELELAGPLNPNPNIRRNVDDQPVDDAESPVKPMLASTVGGTSHHWSSHIPRFRPEDFRTRTLDGVAEDWPISYEDLAPYYELNEAMCGLGYLPGDPSGPARQVASQPLPSIGPHGKRIARALEELGWHWWPVDFVAGFGSEEEPCTHVGPCTFGCPSRRRASSDVAYLEPAMAAGARLETGLRAYRIVCDATGRAAALLCHSDEGEVRVEADRFVVAANGLGTPWLLLNSADKNHPGGLANGSGLVGRNLMVHPHARIDGIFAEPMGSWAPGKTIGVTTNEFYSPREENDFERGFKIQLGAGPSPLAIAMGTLDNNRPLPFGAAHHARMSALFDHALTFIVSSEDLPEEHNRVALSDALCDRDGEPAPKMIYTLADSARRRLDVSIERAKEVLYKAGAIDTHVDPLRSQSGFHLMGTARMGNDPATSVVDANGRCHEVDNLYLADASVFVTGSSFNPTATAQAFALRVADAIIGARA